jgi:hypothetical protein
MIGDCKVDDNCHCANVQHAITTKPMLYQTAEVKQDYLVFRKSLGAIYPGSQTILLSRLKTFYFSDRMQVHVAQITKASITMISSDRFAFNIITADGRQIASGNLSPGNNSINFREVVGQVLVVTIYNSHQVVSKIFAL